MLWILIACSLGEPSTPSDCESKLSAGAKDECYAKVAPDLFRTDPAAGQKLVEENIADVTVRDFVYLKVTREVDPSTTRYCERIQDRVLADRCRVLVSRPHLHRGLATPPGAPPPGSPPPAGGPPGGSAGGPPPGAAPGGQPATPPPGAPPGN